MTNMDDEEGLELVLAVSADGWSLHEPGSTDEQIASGDAPYLVSGVGDPTYADYTEAWRALWRRFLRITKKETKP